MDEAQKKRGVIAYSSGNQAQAVALAMLLSQQVDIRGQAIAVITTGGNVDAADFWAALNTKSE